MGRPLVVSGGTGVIRFRLLDVPVGVHLSFGVVALLGLGVYSGWELVMWTAAVFVAVLAHEFGHALVARAFGARDVAITLFALGGVTTYRAPLDLSPGRRFLIAAAGSAVGIASGAAVLAAGRLGWFSSLHGLALVFLESFVFAALGWGLLNWIPVLPLDGGRMLESLLAAVAPRRATTIAKVVSVVVGAALVVVAWRMGERFLAFFLVLIVLAGVSRGGGDGAGEAPEPDRRSPAEEPPAPPPEFPI